jgi:hypothetical protein
MGEALLLEEGAAGGAENFLVGDSFGSTARACLNAEFCARKSMFTV